MNYEILKASVADWLHRTDLEDVIPTFVMLAESRINRDIRVADMEKELSGNINGMDIDLPIDYRQIKSVVVDDGQYLQYLSHPLGLNETCGYTQIGNKLRLFVQEGSQYRIIYYAAVPSLSDGVQENWLLSKYPDVYLYATLLESAPYIKDDARVQIWAMAYQNAIGTVMQQEEKQRFGNASLAIKRT